MRSYIETAVIVTVCGSAIFWFMSALCRLPSIKAGTDETATVTELSKALQRMSRRNFWAAGRLPRPSGRRWRSIMSAIFVKELRCASQQICLTDGFLIPALRLGRSLNDTVRLQKMI
jgi:hypothetical protein